MQRIWSSGSAVWPPLMWPTTSVSASSTTSLSIRPEPGIEGPPVWMVLWMPYLRAQPTIFRAVGPSLTPPRPTSPNSLTPAAANSLKSSSTISHSITGAPACTFTPPGRSGQTERCAKIAIAFSPTTSRGRPGIWTSPAEIMVVTPPCRKLSIQLIWFCRGVQSPATGWTWLSIRPGATVVPLASTMVVAPSVLTSLARPMAVILPFSAVIVSASRIGLSMAPESNRPILRITSLLGPAAWGASWAMGFSFLFNAFAQAQRHLARGLTAGSSWIIRSYTNDRIQTIRPIQSASLDDGTGSDEQFQPGKRAERPSLDRHPVLFHHHPRSLVPLPQRRVHDDRTEGRRAVAFARLQRRQ